MRSHVFTDICIVPVQLPNLTTLPNWLACTGERILVTRGTKGEGGERTMRNLQTRTGSRWAAEASPPFPCAILVPTQIHLAHHRDRRARPCLLAARFCRLRSSNGQRRGHRRPPFHALFAKRGRARSISLLPLRRVLLCSEPPRRKSVGCANRAAADHREVGLVGKGRLRSLRPDGAKPQ